MTHAAPDRPEPWQAWLIWLGPLLLAAGFCSTRILFALPHAHAAELLAIALAAAAASAAIRRIARLRWADALALVFAIACVAFVGPPAAFAAALVLLGALGLGLVITRGRGGAAVAALCGIALLAGAIGWLLPFPLHTRAVYLVLLVSIALLVRRRLGAELRRLHSAWHGAIDADPASAALAVLCVGLGSVGCWIPTVQFDDLGYHLGLPSQLAALGYYRMDAHSQIWALAPWAGDVVQALAQLLAGGEARGAVDGAWLLAIAALSWQLGAALGLSTRARWACTALAASQPLLAGLVGGMQAELPASATALALALVVARATNADEQGTAWPFALLAGLLLALKTGFIALILPLLLILVWRRRHALRLRSGAIALVLCALVAGSSYAYAALLTGNPLFPLLNATFHSPLMAATDLHDPRWSAPLWDFPWRVTFHSREFGEGWDGLAGFTLLVLLGAIPVSLAQRNLRWLALAALVSGAAALGAVHYFRYAFPALLLLAPCLVGAVYAAWPERAATRLLAVVIALNMLYQGTSFWTLHSGAITREVAALSSEPVLRRFAPERVLIAAARQREPSAHVVLCGAGEPFAAELAGHGFTASHYDPEFETLAIGAEADASGDGWRALFAHANARFAIVDAQASPALRTALRDAHLVQEVGTAQLWELPPAPAGEPDPVRARDAAAQLRR